MNSDFFASLYSRLFSSASIRELADGSLAVQSDPGRYLAWAIAFVVLVPLSLWCWRRRLGGSLAPGFFFAAFTIPLVIVPGIAMETVQVTPGALTLRTGLWFSPTIREIPLRNLDAVIETDRATRQRALPRTATYWSFRYRDGNKRTLHLSDLLAAQRQPVAAYLRTQGISFPCRSGATGDPPPGVRP